MLQKKKQIKETNYTRHTKLIEAMVTLCRIFKEKYYFSSFKNNCKKLMMLPSLYLMLKIINLNINLAYLSIKY